MSWCRRARGPNRAMGSQSGSEARLDSLSITGACFGVSDGVSGVGSRRCWPSLPAGAFATVDTDEDSWIESLSGEPLLPGGFAACGVENPRLQTCFPGCPQS